MEYSICIRTLNASGEKFEKLISSIKKQFIKPKEVIVVVPEFYVGKSIDIENIRIIRSKKGMLQQRIVGIESATTKFILLLDDDLEFDEKLVSELYCGINKNKCDITFPIYKDLLFGKGIRRVVSAITLSSVPVSSKKAEFVKFMSSGGFKYNSDLENSFKYLKSESAPGMCIFAKREKLLKLNLRDELWIDGTEYPLKEDAILAYKAHLNDLKLVGVQGVEIEHLDGGGNEKDRNLKAAYAFTYNHILFWKRFIYGYKKTFFGRVKSKIAIRYWQVSTLTYMNLSALVHKNKKLLANQKRGMKDGFKFIKLHGGDEF